MIFNGLSVREHGFCVILLFVILALPHTLSYAENQSQSPQKELEAWQEALLYSKDHPVITFAIYGRTMDATAKENAQKVQRFLEDRNIQSRYFLADEHDMGSSIGFYIQGVPYGPVGLAKVSPLLHQVIAHYKQEYARAP